MENPFRKLTKLAYGPDDTLPTREEIAEHDRAVAWDDEQARAREIVRFPTAEEMARREQEDRERMATYAPVPSPNPFPYGKHRELGGPTPPQPTRAERILAAQRHLASYPALHAPDPRDRQIQVQLDRDLAEEAAERQAAQQQTTQQAAAERTRMQKYMGFEAGVRQAQTGVPPQNLGEDYEGWENFEEGRRLGFVTQQAAIQQAAAQQAAQQATHQAAQQAAQQATHQAAQQAAQHSLKTGHGTGPHPKIDKSASLQGGMKKSRSKKSKTRKSKKVRKSKTRKSRK